MEVEIKKQPPSLGIGGGLNGQSNLMDEITT
jgi:hypothetical protein